MSDRQSGNLSLLFRLSIAFGIMLGLVIIPAPTAQAFYPEEATERNATLQADDSALEVGAYYVSNYSQAGCPRMSSLPMTRPDAIGLVNRLQSGFFPYFYRSSQWTKRYLYGSNYAWEEDWKRSGAGGKNNDYIDTVDLAYFAGHGSARGIYFGNCRNDDNELSFADARGAWGNKDLDWVALAACNVLDDRHLRDWTGAFRGLRLILGYKTVVDDTDLGKYFGHYIRRNYTLSQAWFRTADRTQSQNRIARVLSAEQAYFNDTYAHHRSYTTVDNDFYMWQHPVGSEPARAVDLSQITEMPVFEVAPLPLSEATNRFEGIGQAFGVSTVNAAAVPSAIGATSNVTETANSALEMDFQSGLYIYTDRDKLWTTDDSEVRAASGQAMRAISQDEARGIADSFLDQNGLMPNDAQFYEVTADIITELSGEDVDEEFSAASADGTLQGETMNYNVVYSRILTWTPPVQAASATADPIEFSVMGPGAKMKVYIDSEVPAGVTAAAVNNEAVLGGVGGYRDVLAPGVRAASADAPATVPVMSEESVELLFEKLEPMVALSYVPQPAVSREILSKTLAYWEGPMDYPQDQLIPVYALTVRSTLVDDTQNVYATYIPVDASYLAPYVEIKPVDVPEDLTIGGTIKLEAADASKTLAELGVDDSLDFAMGIGFYEYEWYLNTVSDETELEDGAQGVVISADGRSLEYTPESDVDELTLILVVIDDGKVGEPRSSQQSYTVSNAVRSLSFDPANNVYLPLVNR